MAIRIVNAQALGYGRNIQREIGTIKIT